MDQIQQFHEFKFLNLSIEVRIFKKMGYMLFESNNLFELFENS